MDGNIKRRGFLKGMAVAVGGMFTIPLLKSQKMGTLEFEQDKKMMLSLYTGYGYYEGRDGKLKWHKRGNLISN